MDSHLVPDMLSRIHIRAFDWPIHDLHVLIVLEKSWWPVPCVEEHHFEPAKRYCERCPLTRARDFFGPTVGKLPGSWGPQQRLALSCLWSDRRSTPWWMAPHCHLSVAHKHQYISPLHVCVLESDHHCAIFWSGTSDKGPNHGVTMPTADGVDHAFLLV